MSLIITFTKFLLCLLLCNNSLSIPRRGKSIKDIWWDTFNQTDVPDKGGRSFPVSYQWENFFKKKPSTSCSFHMGRTCTPYYLCSSFSMNEDANDPVRLRSGSEDLECPLHLEVCCRFSNIKKSSSLMARTFSTMDEYDGPPLDTCGIQNEGGVGVAITGINDSDTQFGEFPWMVAILRVETISAGSVSKEIALYICAGSLIAPNVVLTAAHCVDSYKAGQIKVRLGEWDTQQTYELLPYEELKLRSIILHPLFHKQSLRNDYALLELETSVAFKPHIGTVCLPTINDVNYVKYHTCYASGWGKDTFVGTYQNILKKVKLNVVNSKACVKALRSTRLGKYFRLHKSFACAGGQAGVDTCKGDGGAPLVCNKELGGAFVQVGIVAWGIGCGEEGIPGVYADVAKGIDWIRTELENIQNNDGGVQDNDGGVQDNGVETLLNLLGDYV